MAMTLDAIYNNSEAGKTFGGKRLYHTSWQWLFEGNSDLYRFESMSLILPIRPVLGRMGVMNKGIRGKFRIHLEYDLSDFLFL